jgi:hypothetical protein
VEVGSVVLLHQLLLDRIERVRSLLPKDVPGRGRHFKSLAEDTLKSRERRAAEKMVGLDSLEPEQLDARALFLISVRDQVDLLYTYLARYLTAIPRQYLSGGLLVAVDEISAALGVADYDFLVHSDNTSYMYWTLQLVPALMQEKVLLSPKPEPGPVAINIPTPELDNAFLVPIIAHEVAHIVAKDIASRVQDNRVKEIDVLLQQLEETNDETTRNNWKSALLSWTVELTCDAIATEVWGPSLLFASIVFLPAFRGGIVGSHPFVADRIEITIEQLDLLGWEEVTKDYLTSAMSWVRTTFMPSSSPIIYKSRLEEFLRRGTDALKRDVFDAAKSAVSTHFKPQDFLDAIQAGLLRMLEFEIPPAQSVTGAAIDPWSALLGAWVGVLDDPRQPFEPQKLATVFAEKRFLARFVLKTFQLGNLAKRWQEVSEGGAQ